MFPAWFHALSIAALLLGGACALVIAFDVVRRPQRMGVMNVVWPVAGLFGSLLTLGGYLRYGRADRPRAGRRSGGSGGKVPFAAVVGKGTLHCGAGCAIGDVAAEWLASSFPAVTIALGWHTLFDERMFAVWVLDFAFAFVLGIVFQYLAIVPMRKLGFADGVVAALKADALSLAAWQVGMYGFMAFAQLRWYPRAFGTRADAAGAEFWFAMQIAMVAGFVTAYPVNWWLVRSGIKESM